MSPRRFGRPGLIGMAARTAVVAGTATAVSGGVQRRQANRQQDADEQAAYEAQQADLAAQQRAQQAAADVAAQQPPAAAQPNLIDQLTQLSQLREQGVLSDTEFAAAKAKLIG